MKLTTITLIKCLLIPGMVLFLLIPIPTMLLDGLMAMNLVFPIIFLFIAIFGKKNVTFYSLPTVFLVHVFLSLTIHISFIRKILLNGAAFDGRLIRIIYSLLVLGSEGTTSLIMSTVLFISFLFALVIITNKTLFFSEAAARFVLDVMPGKQMAIDAEYSSGVINQEESMIRRNDLQRETDFYGLIDRAGRIISSISRAGLFITLFSIFVGIIISTKLHGESLITAAVVYIPLSIALGFITQLMLLLVFISIKIIITKSRLISEFK